MFEIEIGYLRNVPCLNKQGSVWCALVERYHDVHTGRGNVGLLCLRTNLMYDVYDCIKSSEVVE